MVDQLVQIVGERVFRVRALMQLRENVAAHGEQRIRGVAAEVHRDVVLPFDFVSEMIFVPRRERIVRVELFVRIAQRDRPDFAVECRAARIASMIVSEGAAGHGVDGRMPRGIELVVGAHDGIGIVLRLRAVVVRAGVPKSERRGVAGGRTVVGGRRHVVTRCRHHGGSDQKEQQGCGFHGIPPTHLPQSGTMSGDRCHSQMGHRN